MTIEEIIDVLQAIKSRDRGRDAMIASDGHAKEIKSVDWMDTADAMLLFIETD